SENLVEGTRRCEIEGLQLTPEDAGIERRYDGGLRDAVFGGGERARQRVIDAAALVARRKQCAHGRGVVASAASAPVAVAAMQSSQLRKSCVAVASQAFGSAASTCAAGNSARRRMSRVPRARAANASSEAVAAGVK